MRNRRIPLLALSLLAVLTATVLTVLATPARAGGDDSPAAQAVRALTTGSAADAAATVPPDFAATMGYLPVLEDGHLVRADGDCSSPVALPATFEPACRQHDYGYDLLRYADATGTPLGTWARGSVDGLLRQRLGQVCAGPAGAADAASCRASAQVAATAVELNSVRQGGALPEESALTRTALASSALGVLGMTAAALPARMARQVPRLRPPTVGTTVLVTAAVLLSLTPSLLPRPAFVQGPLTGVLVALALAAAWSVGRLRGRRRPRELDETWRPGQVGALATAMAVVLAGVVGAGLLAARQADAVGMAAPDQLHWPVVAALAGATAYGLVLLARGLGRAVARMWGLRLGTRLAVLATGGAVSLAAAAPAGDGLLDLLDKDLDPGHVLLQESPAGSGRVYVALAEESEPAAAAELAADRLVAAGGLEGEAVIVLVPTGSGWVNRDAVEAFEGQFGAGLSTVAVQYDQSPSWLSVLTARATSERSAHAVVGAVADRLATVPERERPALYVAGESLGALAGQSALRDPVLAAQVCGALWSGTPGGATLGLPGERSLANSDDPVVHLTAGTATSRPEDWGAALWLPGVSLGTTTLDLAVSLAPDDGHGHRYGPEQDWALPACGPG